jgi:hypothetical protein
MNVRRCNPVFFLQLVESLNNQHQQNSAACWNYKQKNHNAQSLLAVIIIIIYCTQQLLYPACLFPIPEQDNIIFANLREE